MAFLKISEASLRIAGGVIRFVVVLNVPSTRHQQRKPEVSDSDDETSEADNVALFPLVKPPLVRFSAITSMIFVTAGFAGDASPAC